MRVSSGSALFTKVRALYGKRITPTQYEELIALNNVNDVASYLKHKTGYGSVLKNTDEARVKRGELEVLIGNKIFENFAKLCRYEISAGDRFSSFVIANSEIETLLHSLRFVVGQAETLEKKLYILPEYFSKLSKINNEALKSARDKESILNAIKNSDYYKILKEDLESKEPIDLPKVENKLLNYLYQSFFDGIKDSGPKRVEKELGTLFRQYIDATNFVNIIRAKKNKSKKFEHTFQEGSFSETFVEKMLKAENDEEVYRIFESTELGKRLGKLDYAFVDQIPRRLIYDKCNFLMRFSSSSLVVLFSYMFCMQIEISNLVTIIEGIKYKVLKKDLEEMLLLKKTC